MNRILLTTLIAGQIICSAAVWLSLNAGLAAQRTHNYSILRGLEIRGLLTTNSATLIEPGQPGHGFVALTAVRDFHRMSLVLCGGWVLVSIVLLVASARSSTTTQSEPNPNPPVKGIK